nr:hypothetical protein [Sedimentibacter sp.]
MIRDKLKIIFVSIFLLLIIFLYFAVNNAERGANEEKYDILKDALGRSIVQCYAIEGFYPPNVEYLEKNYGLIVNHDKYIISYNVFASNIMPEFDVFRKH